MGLCAFGIRAMQPSVADQAYRVKLREDVVLIPPPKELRSLTLGYNAAAVDYLWSQLLAEYGVHVSEKRGFDVPRYVDGILELEPDYAPLFRFIDTLIAFRPPQGTADDARLARRYLKQGTEARPYDPGVWLQYGQFVAFLAPTFLTEADEVDSWRKEGAHAITKAVELGADTDRSLAASSMLARYGERNAVIRHLRRAYALSEDATTRAEIEAKLAALESSALRDEMDAEARYIEKLRKENAPHLNATQFLLLGPLRDPVNCRGAAEVNPECAFDLATTRARRRQERAAFP
jgi:hypothetical protein